MRELCEIDPQQLSQVTGGGLIARWLARRPLLRALLQELLGGGGKDEGGEGSAGGEAAQGAQAAATGGAGGAPKRGGARASAGAAG
jgi:hypothetical protein